VAWETACKPKDQGGLGIIDIETQNHALLLKFLDKFCNRDAAPWVTLTWSKLYANSQTPLNLEAQVGHSGGKMCSSSLINLNAWPPAIQTKELLLLSSQVSGQGKDSVKPILSCLFHKKSQNAP